MKSYFVYLLYSPSFQKTYVGQTEALSNRLAKHNSGKVKSTKPYKPWQQLYHETFPTRTEAMIREKWFKSKIGRKKISEILKEYLNKHPN